MPITADSIWLTANNIMFDPVRQTDAGSYTISGNNTAGSNSTTFHKASVTTYTYLCQTVSVAGALNGMSAGLETH